MTHTPGPWTAEATPSSLFITRDIWARQDEGPDILVASVGVPERSKLDVHTETANARLIAAAPDLLEALEAMQDLFDHAGLFGIIDHYGKHNGWTKDDLQSRIAACAHARAAINRAKGE